ncbi:hypothetical protein DS901_07510 [Loktanella sp. D2R18]|uniref:hypothetical protein n=1 Tax=Rhodobacterales TaxID=204455 RepID=UPI000DE84C08|nr:MULTISPECIES: hypothetical protein [Rhodobacterales]MDO6589617.1 hypothetical protein [Yoonia sp. 1_MG-2023]RBW44252.1 hypothetical protein DS901_07510 [Loktanella sp. D2R18]
MRKALSAIFASFLISQPADAQPIPGADDPALLIAAQRWLDSENPVEDIWALGEIAADGNIAARMFVTRIMRSVHMDIDFPEFDHDERKALVPADRSGARTTISSPYYVDWDVVPAMVALREIDHADDIETWIALAERTWAAGYQPRVLKTLGRDRRLLEIDIARYLETRFPLDMEIRATVWWIRMFHAGLVEANNFLEPGEAEAIVAHWGGLPWRAEDTHALDDALRDGRWHAVRFLAYLPNFRPAIIEDLRYAEQHEKVAEFYLQTIMVRDSNPGFLEGDERLVTMGDLLIAEAEHTTLLRPLVTVCERLCGAEIADCVARGEILGLDRFTRSFFSGGLIASSDYNTSERAVSALMKGLSNMAAREEPYMTNGLLPQCLTDTAVALSDE